MDMDRMLLTAHRLGAVTAEIAAAHARLAELGEEERQLRAELSALRGVAPPSHSAAEPAGRRVPVIASAETVRSVVSAADLDAEDRVTGAPPDSARILTPEQAQAQADIEVRLRELEARRAQLNRANNDLGGAARMVSRLGGGDPAVGIKASDVLR